MVESAKSTPNEDLQGVIDHTRTQFEDRRQPSLYVRDGKLVYLTSADQRDLEITGHTGESNAILAASAVFWYLGCQARVIATEPETSADLEVWQEAAALLTASKATSTPGYPRGQGT